jgi:predicted TIM-barrel fold metal-dependent hydrolase
MQSVAETYGFPHAHVAQAWMDADNVADILKAQSKIPIVKSVRHKPRAAASPDRVVIGAPGSMGDPDWRRGYAMLEKYGFHFDLQTPWWHLNEAADLAGDFPNTLMILNHTGLPADRSESGLSGWRKAMKTFAELPNVAVKISGLGLCGKTWRIEDNQSIIRDTINIFGIDRCMYASNFPVDGVVANYNTIITGYKKAVADLTMSDQSKFFHDNTVKIYGI